jgi:hypothetical protein
MEGLAINGSLILQYTAVCLCVCVYVRVRAQGQIEVFQLVVQ